MAYAKNKVITGDYRDGAVDSVLGEVFITRGSAGRLPLNMDTVESCEMMPEEQVQGAGTEPAEGRRAYCIALRFRDGKRSLLEVDRDLGVAIIKNCLAEAKARCGPTPEQIKLCDPHSKANCRECPCFRCVLWPNCCYGRMHDRRAAYGKPDSTIIKEAFL